MRAVPRRFALVLVGVVFSQGCRDATNPPVVAEKAEEAEEAKEPEAASGPKRADGDIATREGEVRTSKGFGAVADVLIPDDALQKHFGRDWRTTAVGKRVRVTGKLRIHKCGPQEQCLIQGELPILTPDSIEELP